MPAYVPITNNPDLWIACCDLLKATATQHIRDFKTGTTFETVTIPQLIRNEAAGDLRVWYSPVTGPALDAVAFFHKINHLSRDLPEREWYWAHTFGFKQSLLATTSDDDCTAFLTNLESRNGTMGPVSASPPGPFTIASFVKTVLNVDRIYSVEVRRFDNSTPAARKIGALGRVAQTKYPLGGGGLWKIDPNPFRLRHGLWELNADGKPVELWRAFL